MQPYVARHETDIDRNLLELRTRAGDMAVMYCQKAAKYGQTQVFEVLQYVASRSSGSRTNQVLGDVVSFFLEAVDCEIGLADLMTLAVIMYFMFHCIQIYAWGSDTHKNYAFSSQTADFLYVRI